MHKLSGIMYYCAGSHDGFIGRAGIFYFLICRYTNAAVVRECKLILPRLRVRLAAAGTNAILMIVFSLGIEIIARAISAEVVGFYARGPRGENLIIYHLFV